MSRPDNNNDDDDDNNNDYNSKISFSGYKHPEMTKKLKMLGSQIKFGKLNVYSGGTMWSIRTNTYTINTNHQTQKHNKQCSIVKADPGRSCYMGKKWVTLSSGRCGGLMVSALDPGASSPASSPGWGHCVVFLGKTLYSHSASLHPGV